MHLAKFEQEGIQYNEKGAVPYFGNAFIVYAFLPGIRWYHFHICAVIMLDEELVILAG